MTDEEKAAHREHYKKTGHWGCRWCSRFVGDDAPGCDYSCEDDDQTKEATMLELRFKLDVNEDGTCGVGCPFHRVTKASTGEMVQWCMVYMPDLYHSCGTRMPRAEKCKRQAVEVKEDL